LAVASREIEIRPLRADDDLDAQLDLSERAFGLKDAGDRDLWHRLMAPVIADGAIFGAFDGGRAVGTALFLDMRQWWHGRAVPMAGVSGVKVAPEDRGRGVGRRLMTALLDEITGRGYPLSALYPATTPLYRSLGWELAGGLYTAKIPVRSLRTLVPEEIPRRSGEPGVFESTLRRGGPADAQAAIDIIGRGHEAAGDCGPATYDVTAMAGYLTRPSLYTYVCDDGFTSYRWDNGNDLFVGGVHGGSAETVRGLWSIIASHAANAGSVRAWTAPSGPLWWLTQEPDAEIESRVMWMLRVVDAPAAIAARGFPPLVSMTIPLVIEDSLRPANSGAWTLTVAGGKGSLLPGGPARAAAALFTLRARGLAALYAGTPVATLRLAGLAAGGSADGDAALDGAFAASPFMLEAF
jgi:predicted acetyltransferase